MSFKVLHGDALEVARGMEPGSVHCIITSPPYWGLRDYGVDSAIGLEVTPEEYVARVVEMFRAFRPVLRDDGTVFLNLGDCYAGSWGNYGAREGNQRSRIAERWHRPAYEDNKSGWDDLPPTANVPGLKHLDRCDIPGDVVRALRADGWYWRQTIIWNKPNPMPESMQGWRWEKHKIQAESGKRGRERQRVGAHPDRPQQDHNGRDFQSSTKWVDCPGCEKCLPHGGYVLVKGSGRPTTSHEYIFLLSKTDNYFYDSEAVREEHQTIGDKSAHAFGRKANAGGATQGNAHSFHSAGRNMRSVWTFPAGQAEWEYCDNCHTLFTGPNRSLIHRIPDSKIKDRLIRQCPKCKRTDAWVDHFAAFPEELPKRCIKAGTSEKGVCKKCGAPWVRVVKVIGKQVTKAMKIAGCDSQGEYHGEAQGDYEKANAQNPSDTKRRILKKMSQVTEHDWLPSCDCDAGEPVPAVVWDPFCGSGQTGIAALNLGRSFVGIDMKREYCDVTIARLRELSSQQRLI